MAPSPIRPQTAGEEVTNGSYPRSRLVDASSARLARPGEGSSVASPRPFITESLDRGGHVRNTGGMTTTDPRPPTRTCIPGPAHDVFEHADPDWVSRYSWEGDPPVAGQKFHMHAPDDGIEMTCIGWVTGDGGNGWKHFDRMYSMRWYPGNETNDPAFQFTIWMWVPPKHADLGSKTTGYFEYMGQGDLADCIPSIREVV